MATEQTPSAEEYHEMCLTGPEEGVVCVFCPKNK